MLKTCSGGHDRCTFQGPGSGSYHADGMNSSISKGNSLISITYNPVIEFVKLNDPVHKHTKSMQS